MRELNPEIELDRVSSQGYTDSNMNSYYNGCFLLHKRDKDSDYTLVFVQGVNDGGFYVDTVGHSLPDGVNRQCIPYTDCYRFVVPQGFYITPKGNLFRYSYRQSRSYKKGLYSDYVMREGAGIGRSSAMLHVVFPRQSDFFRVLSRRVVEYKGCLYTAYKNLRVGKIVGGVAETPFDCIKQRIEEQL